MMFKYLKQVLDRFKGSSRKLKLSYAIILIISLTGLFSNFIANDVPLVGKKGGELVFPAVKDFFYDLGLVSWKDRLKYQSDEVDYSFRIATPIPYKSQDMDHKNAGYVSPFGKQELSAWHRRHWLGTDQIGRDVTAGLVNGCRVSLIVGFFSCLLALLIGIPLGLLAGYYGNQHYKLSFFGLGLLIITVILGFYILNYYGLVWLLWTVLFLGFLMAYLVERIISEKRKWIIPLDTVITKVIEVFKSIPGIILLFVLLGVITQSSIWNIVICLGLLSWYKIARYIRGEIMSIREREFIMAQRSIGQADSSIIFNHCLKLALPPVLISVVFLFASVILMESTLSFLGIGLPVETVSWGTMLSEARKYFPAWWMAFFPGLGILAAILALHTIAEHWIATRHRA